jgi:hypothetical protein
MTLLQACVLSAAAIGRFAKMRTMSLHAALFLVTLHRLCSAVGMTLFRQSGALAAVAVGLRVADLAVVQVAAQAVGQVALVVAD